MNSLATIIFCWLLFCTSILYSLTFAAVLPQFPSYYDYSSTKFMPVTTRSRAKLSKIDTQEVSKPSSSNSGQSSDKITTTNINIPLRLESSSNERFKGDKFITATSSTLISNETLLLSPLSSEIPILKFRIFKLHRHHLILLPL